METALAIAIGAIETMGAEPFFVADEGVTAGVVAVGCGLYVNGCGGDVDTRCGTAEA